MKNVFFSLLVLALAFQLTSCSTSGRLTQGHESINLNSVSYEVPVSLSQEEAWNILASYGNVGDYHAGVKSSSSINGSDTKATLECDRVCYLQNGKQEIMVKERIVDIQEGSYYTYDVYEWDNFPLQKMRNTFGVKTGNAGETIIYQVINYRLKPGMMTGMMKGKIKKQARDALLAYKHYMETGIENGNWDTIQEMYTQL